jgi:ABC-type amino acid transport substrate-binding protein
MQSTYGNTAQALADLESGKVDGLVIEILQANIFLQSFYAGKFRIIATPLTNEGIRLVLRIDEGAERFVELLNQGLEEMRENGSYEALLRAWL